ncbi:MAG: hypothetical protein GY797_33005 [Deltaproteobacteria bacterium]|nr:hypothetical protein [Deltaproteobacteria bacterium]
MMKASVGGPLTGAGGLRLTSHKSRCLGISTLLHIKMGLIKLSAALHKIAQIVNIMAAVAPAWLYRVCILKSTESGFYEPFPSFRKPLV